MSLIGTTLTLPGIAGMVLTRRHGGRRQRAHLRAHPRGAAHGQDADRGHRAGFQRAFVTIIDSQLTTLAAAVVMFWLGSGPIRGFAVTLTIGICTSMFTAVTVTAASRRTGGSGAEGARRSYRRSAGLDEAAMLVHGSFPISRATTSSRTTCGCPSCATRACASGSLSCHGAVAAAVLHRGLNYGVDFKGGSMIEVQSKTRPGRHARQPYASSTRSASAPCRSRASAPTTDVLIRVEQQPRWRGRAAGRAQEGGRSARRRIHAAPRRGRCGPAVSSELRRTGIHRRARRPAGDHRLRLVPLRVAVRGRCVVALRTTCW